MHRRLALPLVGILALVAAVAFLALSSAGDTVEVQATPDPDSAATPAPETEEPVNRTATFALG